jgi:aryl-alcohol dehydrogenase-like predicted oxidoreductase
MRQRTLGRQGLTTSAIGLGTTGMTMAYGAGDEKGGEETIRRAHELGVSFLDTAELYGNGTGSNEKLVGRAVSGFREEMVIATRFGWRLPYEEHMNDPCDSRPERIRAVTENSLRYPVPTTATSATSTARWPAWSASGSPRARWSNSALGSRAGDDPPRPRHVPVSVLEAEYSIFERAVEAGVLPAVRELGIGFVPYSPLGRGFLTGDFKPAADYPADDMRNGDERWQPGSYERNVAVVRQLTALADGKGITVTQLALAWLLAQGDDIVPIPGTRRPGRVAANAAAADVELSAADLARIGEILPDGAFGGRYPAAMMPSW